MSSAPPIPRRYICSVCGRKDTAERMVFSPHTGNHYCADLGACDRRKRRTARRVASELGAATLDVLVLPLVGLVLVGAIVWTVGELFGGWAW